MKYFTGCLCVLTGMNAMAGAFFYSQPILWIGSICFLYGIFLIVKENK